MNYRLCAFADEASASLTGQIAAMERNGISLLEIRGIDGENISQLTEQKVRLVASTLASHGLGVWSIGSPIGKIRLQDDFAAHVEIFKRLLDFSGILGAKAFRLFSFYEAQGETQEVIDRLGTLCQLAKPYEAKLCHENEKGIYGDTAPRVKELLDALPELGGIFDPANYIQCEQPILPAWEMLKNRTDYLHIKDALKSGVVVPSGHGDGHIGTVVAEFLRKGGQVLTLEPHLMEFTGLKSLEEEEGRTPLGCEQFRYRDNDEAFDAATRALKDILERCGAVPRQ